MKCGGGAPMGGGGGGGPAGGTNGWVLVGCSPSTCKGKHKHTSALKPGEA